MYILPPFLTANILVGVKHPLVSYTSFFKKSTSEPIRRKFDEVILKEDEAWERS
jgi:hypothetical protein